MKRYWGKAVLGQWSIVKDRNCLDGHTALSLGLKSRHSHRHCRLLADGAQTAATR